MADTSEQDLAAVQDYAAEQEANGLGSDVERYAKRSAQFAALGGAIGSVVPGVGTAIGGLVGAAGGVVYEGVSDIIDLLDDGPKHVKESAADAEKSFYVYQAMGGEKGTGLSHRDWWKLYVEAGRPSLELLKQAKNAERAAKRAANKAGVPPPPPPPPPKKKAASQPKAQGSVALAPGAGPSKDIQALVAVPLGRVSVGQFVKDPSGQQGFLLDLNTGLMTSGKFAAR